MKKQWILIGLLLAGCGYPLPLTTSGGTLRARGDFPTQGKLKALTFLSYQAVNNNLQSSLASDLDVLEQVIDPTKMNIVVEADTLSLAYSPETGFKNVGHRNKDKGYRFFIQPDAQPGIHSAYQEIPDPNSGDGNHLRDVITWGFSNYPGTLKVLDIRSHGHGPLGIADDFNSQSNIALPELEQAISAGTQKIDVLTTKACLMATVEVGYQLSSCVRYLVASENGMMTQAGEDSLLYRSLGKLPNDPREFAIGYTREGMGVQGDRRTVSTFSAMDLEKAKAIVPAVKELHNALLALIPTRKVEIQAQFKSARNWGRAQTQTDLYDLASKLESLGDPNLSQACQKVKTAVKAAILINITDQTNQLGTNGASILTQINSGNDATNQTLFKRYQATDFDKEVGWSSILEQLGAFGPERKDNVG